LRYGFEDADPQAIAQQADGIIQDQYPLVSQGQHLPEIEPKSSNGDTYHLITRWR
jgi:hypothetical protein